MTKGWGTSDFWEELQGDGLAPEVQGIGVGGTVLGLPYFPIVR